MSENERDYWADTPAFKEGYNDGWGDSETHPNKNPYPAGSQEFWDYEAGYYQGSQDW